MRIGECVQKNAELPLFFVQKEENIVKVNIFHVFLRNWSIFYRFK